MCESELSEELHCGWPVNTVHASVIFAGSKHLMFVFNWSSIIIAYITKQLQRYNVNFFTRHQQEISEQVGKEVVLKS